MWLSIKEVEEQGIAARTIRHKLKSGEWESRETGERGRNGKPIREVSLESLPHELQLKIVRNHTVDESASLIDGKGNEEAGWQPALREEVGEPPALRERSLTINSHDLERNLIDALKRYEPEAREAFLAEAQRLFEIINQYEAIEPKRRKNLATGKYDFTAEVYALCEEAICTDQSILLIEPKRAKRPSPITLDQWMRKSKTLGLLAFIRSNNKAAKKDKRKARISAEATEWINSHWRKFPSPRHLYKNLAREAKKQGWTIPSESWIYRKYSALPKIVATKTFGSEKNYQSRFAPFVPRTVADLEALQILCGDHSVRDLSVVLPDGTLTRPWLTVWQCLRTGLIWGWHLDVTPSSQTIGLAYVNGVKTFGAQPTARPDQNLYSYLYTDQGRDYRSKTFTGKTLEFKNASRIDGGLKVLTTQREVGFLDEMQLKHIMARGYNAKEKAVERLFRDISDWEQIYFENEYCGRDAKSKPDRWVRAFKRHKKLQTKFSNQVHIICEESPFIDFDSYRENLAGFIHEYNISVHRRSVLGGAKTVPLDEFNRLYTTKYEISDDALSLLLMKADRRKIGKNGIQMFQSHWYFLHPDMAEFKGEQVEVRYDDSDYSRIYAVLPNSRIVEAELITPSSILNPNKKTMERVAKQANYERKVVRDFQLIQQSQYRGESVEDRIPDAMKLVEEEEVRATGTGGGAKVHQFTRMSKPISRKKTVKTTPDQIPEDAELKSADTEQIRIRDAWEEDYDGT